MKHPVTFAVALILMSGCTSSPPAEVIVAPPEPPPAPMRHAAPLPIPPLPPSTDIARFTPAEIQAAADQARADATGYVAWKHSRPENIDRLTDLTSALNEAVARMRATKTHGRYADADVVSARSALQDLRWFLSTKGD